MTEQTKPQLELRLDGPRSRYVRVPQWWLHAISLYARLTGAERIVLDTICHYIWGWSGSGRLFATIPMSEIYDRCPNMTQEGLRRALVALRTPGDQDYVWSGGKRSKRGHGMVVLERAGTARLDAVYSLQTDWRLWGWEDGTSLDLIAAILANYEVDDAPATWSEGAEALARLLRERAARGLGAQALVPMPQQQDRVWRRWCTSMERLAKVGVTPSQMRSVLEYVDQDDYYDSRLRGHKADLVLVDCWSSLVVRAHRSRMRRY